MRHIECYSERLQAGVEELGFMKKYGCDDKAIKTHAILDILATELGHEIHYQSIGIKFSQEKIDFIHKMTERVQKTTHFQRLLDIESKRLKKLLAE